MRTRISVALVAALVGCGNSNSVTCGDGTTLVDGVCQLGSGGSGEGDTCGSGTMLDGTTCVPIGNDAGAPTISMITPPDTGVSGLTPFEIDGTGFAGDNVTSLTVFFGDTTNPNCQAPVIAATPTTIAGQIPPFCDINVTVSVTTNLGTATVPFHYDAIFAADGDGGGTYPNEGGELWVIDPFTTTAFDFGPMLDAGQDAIYGMSGLAFDSTGKLWGVTTGDSYGDTDFTSQLVTIDPTTPDFSTVTVIGDVTDADENEYFVGDIKLVNGTLYAWADFTNGEDFNQGMITIDMTTGAATVLGTPAVDDFFDGGLGIDGSNVMWLAAEGAGSDDTSVDPVSGELDTVDTNGALTASANVLDWGIGAPINAMDYFAPAQVMIAVVDNGTYGVENEDTEDGAPPEFFGETLATVDTSTGDVEPAFELPAETGAQSAIDAIAIPSSPTATLQIAKKLHAAKQVHLGASALPAMHAPHAHAHAHATRLSMLRAKLAKLRAARR